MNIVNSHYTQNSLNSHQTLNNLNKSALTHITKITRKPSLYETLFITKQFIHMYYYLHQILKRLCRNKMYMKCDYITFIQANTYNHQWLSGSLCVCVPECVCERCVWERENQILISIIQLWHHIFVDFDQASFFLDLP